MEIFIRQPLYQRERVQISNMNAGNDIRFVIFNKFIRLIYIINISLLLLTLYLATVVITY